MTQAKFALNYNLPIGIFLGSNGDDFARGFAGSDLLFGFDGDDILLGRAGSDVLAGGYGDDFLKGGAGDDLIGGGAGDDVVRAGKGDDIVFGGSGKDAISGGRGNDIIIGGEGTDVIRGGQGDDVVIWNFGDGSDIVRGGQGYDLQSVNGSEADDVFAIASIGRRIEVDIAGDQIQLRQVEALNVNGGIGADRFVLSGDVANDADISLDGGADGDQSGFTLINTVSLDVSVDAAGQAADLDSTLEEALAGNIYFNAHSTDFPAGEVRGQLTLLADLRDENGEGSVVFGATLSGDEEVQDPPVVTDATGAGSVTFITDKHGVFTYDVSLTVRGVTLDELTVLHLHNAPAGANGPVVVDLLADAGADPAANGVEGRFDGTAFDANTLGDALDLADLDEGVFADLDVNFAGRVAPGLSQDGAVQNIGVISGEAETLNLAANDIEDVTGTAFGDRLFGNAEDNILAGGAGDDDFHTFAGNDIYDGGEGIDTALLLQATTSVFADLEEGVAVVGDDVNALVSIENFRAGIFDDVVSGDEGANLIFGNDGNDILNGRGGDDVLIGGAGDADVLTGGAGADTFQFANGDGNGTPGSADQINDFSTADDRFALDASSFGLDGDAALTFANVARDGDALDAATFDGQANVYVLQGSFANAGAARDAIADARIDVQGAATDEADAGFFIYFNEGQGRNRLFAVEDLDQVGGGIQQVANLGGTLDLHDPLRDDALAQLETFSAENFTFDLA